MSKLYKLHRTMATSLLSSACDESIIKASYTDIYIQLFGVVDILISVNEWQTVN